MKCEKSTGFKERTRSRLPRMGRLRRKDKHHVYVTEHTSEGKCNAADPVFSAGVVDACVLSCDEGSLGWLAGPGSMLVSMGQCTERLLIFSCIFVQRVVSCTGPRIFPCPSCKMPAKSVSMPASYIKIFPVCQNSKVA